MGSVSRQNLCEKFIDAFKDYFQEETWLEYNDLYCAVFEYAVVIVNGNDREFMSLEPLFDGETGIYDVDLFAIMMADKCGITEKKVLELLRENELI